MLADSVEVVALNFLQTLNLVHARNLAHSVDDVFQMLQVGNIEHYVDIGSPVGGARLDVADVRVGVADHSRNLLQHARAVVTMEREFDRKSSQCEVLVSYTLDVYAAIGFIHQISYVRAFLC